MAPYGIDFGTTTSGLVQLLSGGRMTIGDDEGKPLPSIVAIDRATGEAFGGREAWNRRFELSEHGNYWVIPSIKPFLASDRQWPTNRKVWSPVDVAAFVFQQLADRARKGKAAPVTSVTVAIPVGMSAEARRRIRRAAAIVGMEVEAFVAESTAAVFRYYAEHGHLHRVAVFDWGGGTLDISVVEFRRSGIFEIGLGGTPTAGNAMDREIALNLHARIMRERGETRAFDDMDPHDQNELLFRSEELKQRLTFKPETTLAIGAYGGLPVHMEVTCASLRPTLLPAVTEAISLLETTIHRAGLSVDGVDSILLIGGSSQLWLLREELASDARFAGRWQLAESPEWDVAHGAALLSREPGAYALAETLELKLADGSRIQLARPGDSPGAPERTLSLVLIEDAPEAHLVIERRGDSTSTSAPGLQFSTPTLGFLEEEITLRYGLTPDLTFSAAATSGRFSSEGKPYEIEDLRFGYALSEARQ